MIEAPHNFAASRAAERQNPPMLSRVVAVALLTLASRGVAAQPSTVAVAAAANLTYAVSALNDEFSRSAPDTRVTVTLGSSGNLFAQITHGAPFDVFLSADTNYPRQLIDAQAAVPESLLVFATGRLVLWTARENLKLDDIAGAIRSPAVAKVAIAQPAIAPYGRAAVNALSHLGVYAVAEPKLVVGENIAQTAQFVETGNADCGFVALSLLSAGPLARIGRWVEVTPAEYGEVSLDHAAVITEHGKSNAAAAGFVAFLRSPAAKRILESYGYRVP